MYALGCGCLHNERAVFGREITVAKRYDPIAVERAAPQGAVFGPTFGICEQSLYEALRHPDVMSK